MDSGFLGLSHTLLVRLWRTGTRYLRLTTRDEGVRAQTQAILFVIIGLDRVYLLSELARNKIMIRPIK